MPPLIDDNDDQLGLPEEQDPIEAISEPNNPEGPMQPAQEELEVSDSTILAMDSDTDASASASH